MPVRPVKVPEPEYRVALDELVVVGPKKLRRHPRRIVAGGDGPKLDFLFAEMFGPTANRAGAPKLDARGFGPRVRDYLPIFIEFIRRYPRLIGEYPEQFVECRSKRPKAWPKPSARRAVIIVQETESESFHTGKTHDAKEPRSCGAPSLLQFADLS